MSATDQLTPPAVPPGPEVVDDLEREEREWLANVYRGDELPELTLRVVLLGLGLSVLTIVFDVYMGLETGRGEGGAMISVSRTMASASGSLGNIVNVIPALFMLQAAGIVVHASTFFDTGGWCFFTSLLGVVFAIPLRKRIVVVEKIAFPTGAAANGGADCR